MSFSRCFVACQTVSSTCPSRPAPRQPLRPPTQPVRLATASNTDRPAPRPQEAPLSSRPIPASPTVADADGAVVRTQQARKDKALAAMLAPSDLSACPLPSTSTPAPLGESPTDVLDPTLLACQTLSYTRPLFALAPSLSSSTARLQHQSDGYTPRRAGKSGTNHKPPGAARPAATEGAGCLRQRRAWRGRCG